MRFEQFLREYTGLSLYDFRVLDDGTSEHELRGLFQMWCDEYHPIPQLITDGMIAAADEGFSVSIAD